MRGRTIAVAVSAALAVGLVGPLAAPTASAAGPLVCVSVTAPWDEVPEDVRENLPEPPEEVPLGTCVSECDAVDAYSTARGAHEATREALPAVFCAY